MVRRVEIPPRVRRIATHCFIAAVLFFFLLDALPRTSLYHAELKAFLDPVGDITGTWQGTWQLFSPTPDKVNERISADVEFSDGTVGHWITPRWRDMSVFERFVEFRYLEYFDDIAGNGNPRAWSRLADYIARTVTPPGPDVEPKKVTLKRHRVTIASPTDKFAPLDAYLDPKETTVLYTREYK